MTKYLSKEDAAKYLGTSTRTIERLLARREIPFYRFGESKTSRIRICLADLDKWAAKYREDAVTA